MGVSFGNNVFDKGLEYIETNCDKITVCSAEPTTYAEGLTTYALADVATSGTDFTIGDGDVSGRKLAVSELSGFTVDSSGTATHIAMLYTTGTELLAVTTCTSQAVTAGNPLVIQTYDLEITDPV